MKKILFLSVIALFFVSGCSLLDFTDEKEEEETESTEEVEEENETTEEENENTEETVTEEQNGNTEESVTEENGSTEEANTEEETNLIDNIGEEAEEDEKANETNGNKEPLTLQMTKVDEEEGYTIEENELYSHLNQLIEENPDQGVDNDFSLYAVDTIEHPDGTQLLLLGINRLNKPIEDITFDFTLGNNEGEFVWEGMPITLPNEEFGPFKVDHAMPIILPVTDEQIQVVNTITTDNQVFEIENFNYSEAE